MKTQTGLDRLLLDTSLHNKVGNKFSYLCHGASVTADLEIGPFAMRKVFGTRLKSLMSPQHGFFGDVQANMIESEDSFHPAFNLPIHSLYSRTRVPTDAMLDGIDTIVVDLQDVGTRVYTYIHTMTLLMEKCAQKKIKVVILDRPNPIGGLQLEGTILDPAYATFVGRHPIPMRHGMTMGEMAKFAATYYGANCEFEVIPMLGWKRSMYFEETGLPWVWPSPNVPTVDTTVTYVGTVVLEGTNLSEGRGTTKPLELIAHPAFEPFGLTQEMQKILTQEGVNGCVLRPCSFIPTFDKHQGKSCGGFQIHVTNRKAFKSWLCLHVLLREFYHRIGKDFSWRPPPYEYEEKLLPMDILNGTPAVREWIETRGSAEALMALEQSGLASYIEKFKAVQLYC
jgi:uncharacterized protein YbbC (DUF1343 family)